MNPSLIVDPDDSKMVAPRPSSCRDDWPTIQAGDSQTRNHPNYKHVLDHPGPACRDLLLRWRHLCDRRNAETQQPAPYPAQKTKASNHQTIIIEGSVILDLNLFKKKI